METLTQTITLGNELNTMADNSKAWVYFRVYFGLTRQWLLLGKQIKVKVRPSNTIC